MLPMAVTALGSILHKNHVIMSVTHKNDRGGRITSHPK